MKPKLTNSQLRALMESTIESVSNDAKNTKLSSNQRAYSAHALCGLVKSYKELFGIAPDETKLKSVKNF